MSPGMGGLDFSALEQRVGAGSFASNRRCGLVFLAATPRAGVATRPSPMIYKTRPN
jgi:hypothetical protein